MSAKNKTIILGLIILITLLATFIFQAPKKIRPGVLLNENSTAIETANIKISAPVINQEVSSPLQLSGLARVFENQLNYRLRDDHNAILAEGTLYASSTSPEQFGQFFQEIKFANPETAAGVLEIFDYSAKDGSEIDKVSVPVKFKTSELTLKVYFGNNKIDPQMLDCQKVFAVERKIPYTTATANAALVELLKGVTAEEKAAGYFSNIPATTKLQRIEITDQGVAKADFNDQLDFQVGGSCRVANIRAQIMQTLLQFPTVKSVIISINGRSEDILQP